MSRVNKEEVARLITLLGGKENIVSAIHCVTRLRLVLVDDAKVDVEQVTEIPLVKGVFNQAGQFQIIIGNEVPYVYAEFMAQTGLSAASKEEHKAIAKKRQSFLEATLSNLSEIFVPILPAIIAGGLILGLRNVLEGIDFGGYTLVQKYGWVNALNSFLWVPGEAIFHFLPVMLCWSTVRKFKGTEVLGIVLGIMLVSPQLLNAYGYAAAVEAGTVPFWDFGWFQIQKVGYQAQVLPAIFGGYALVLLERFFRKITHPSIDLIVVPIVSLLLALIIAYTVLGPISRLIGDGIAAFFMWMFLGPLKLLGAVIFGFFYAPLVITGLHHTFIAVDLQLAASELGGTMIWPLIALSNICQGSAVCATLLLYKDVKHREVATSSLISAWLGVTEPAMYGVNLKLKYPFLAAIISSATAAIVSIGAGVLANGIGVGGLPAILSIQPRFYVPYLLAMLVAVVMPMVLTLVFYKVIQKRTSEIVTEKETGAGSLA